MIQPTAVLAVLAVFRTIVTKRSIFRACENLLGRSILVMVWGGGQPRGQTAISYMVHAVAVSSYTAMLLILEVLWGLAVCFCCCGARSG